MTQRGARTQFQGHLRSLGVEVVEFDFLTPDAVASYCYERGFLQVVFFTLLHKRYAASVTSGAYIRSKTSLPAHMPQQQASIVFAACAHHPLPQFSHVGHKMLIQHVHGVAVLLPWCELYCTVLQVLWECGGTLAAPAVAGGVVHKVMAFVAPKIIGGERAPTPVGELGNVEMTQALTLIDPAWQQVRVRVCVRACVRVWGGMLLLPLPIIWFRHWQILFTLIAT